MNSIIKGLLIFTLFVTLSIGADIQLANFTGPIGQYPIATPVNIEPFYWTGFPGPAFVEITAVSSVAVCVSQYAAVTNNLAKNCPNPLNFFYASSPENEFLLFLDDFSMNFMGQDGRSSNNALHKGQAPYSTQRATIDLLQNVPYYISIGLIDNFNANSTEREILDFSLSAHLPKCKSGTVPERDVSLRNLTTNGGCIPLQYQLNTTEAGSSSTVLTVNSMNSVVFSFTIDTLAYAANLDFHVQSETYNLTIYFGYGYVPNQFHYDFNVSNSTVGLMNSEISGLFLNGEILQSFSREIMNPKVGTYYAQVFSSLLNVDTNFSIEFNVSECDLFTENGCGSLDIPFTTSGEMNVQNITLTGEITYLSVLGQGVQFGLTTSSGVAFVQVDINAIPTGLANQSYIQITNDTISVELNSFFNQSYVFGLLSTGPLNAQDSVSALVWTGSTCPNDCSGEGTCDVVSLSCTCNGNFTGTYCQEAVIPPKKGKKLSTLYIILIIIGGAILLAVLIGVPVALFLNNRKKARYERV